MTTSSPALAGGTCSLTDGFKRVLHLDSVISVSIEFIQCSINVPYIWPRLGLSWRWAATDGTPIAPYTTEGGSLLRPSHSVSGLSNTFHHLVSIVSAAQSVGHGGSAEANADRWTFVFCRGHLLSKPDPIPLHWNGATGRRMVIGSWIAQTEPTKTPPSTI